MSTPFRLPIQHVSADGFSAWLVEDHSIPVISLSWSWQGGAALDPAGNEGAAAMASRLLIEGAGDMPATAFTDVLRDSGIRLSFSVWRDTFEGGFRCLIDALPEAERLARLAMIAPRFDVAAVEQIRARSIAGVRQTLETPRGQASRAFWAEAFPSHSAGRPSGGSVESLASLTPEVIRAVLTRQLRRDGVTIAAAGAIRPEALAALLGRLFGVLPAGSPSTLPLLPTFTAFGQRVIKMESPQSQAIFGQQGLGARDPDLEAAQVMLRILGGGGFSSRLTAAVRERRGLSYGISIGLNTGFSGGALIGGVASSNRKIAEALAVTRAELKRMTADGPTEAEVEEAIAYLTGSFALEFTDSLDIAAHLLATQRHGYPLDWLDKRTARLHSLTRDDIARVAGNLLKPDQLAVVIAGEPEGV